MSVHITKNFTYDELMCPCCGKMSIDATAIEMLQKARDIAGIAFQLNSVCRCKAHNKKVGSEDSSSHVIADGRNSYAFDIKATDSRTRFIILGALLNAGFNRIGIDKAFIHVDSDTSKDENVVWVY